MALTPCLSAALPSTLSLIGILPRRQIRNDKAPRTPYRPNPRGQLKIASAASSLKSMQCTAGSSHWAASPDTDTDTSPSDASSWP